MGTIDIPTINQNFFQSQLVRTILNYEVKRIFNIIVSCCGVLSFYKNLQNGLSFIFRILSIVISM